MYLVRVGAYRSSHFCSGVARIFQRGGGGKARERSGRRGCPPSMVRRFLKICVKKKMHIEYHYRGRLCVVALTNPLPFSFSFPFFTLSSTGGHVPPSPTYASAFLPLRDHKHSHSPGRFYDAKPIEHNIRKHSKIAA